MKIKLVIFLAALCSGINLYAQDIGRIMDWKTENTLRTFLLQEVREQYDQRRSDVSSAMKTKASLEEYRNKCRQRYVQILGELPDDMPLTAQVTNTIDRGSYSVENIILEPRPGHHITANLYLPESSKPSPAVLLFCGHEMTSKATESYQKTAILFALNGFVVLATDPISQGERVQFTDSLGKRILRGSTTEHTLLNAGASLTGSGVVAWELYDNKRSLDYLVSRPEVDPDRIGCLGNSGGGTQTAYFIGFDNRIKVAAPCSYIARRERNLELSGASDGCQHIPFEGREHLEIADLLIIFSPKPLLILAGRFDFVDYSGTEETFRELEKVYKVSGSEEKVRLFTFDDGHGISKPKREAAVEWFKLWLCNEKVKVTEGEIAVLDEASLNCTSTGQVNSYFADEKDVQYYNLKAATDMAVQRNEFLEKTSASLLRQKILSLLAIDDRKFSVEEEIRSVTKNDTCTISVVILRREGEVPIPCLCYIPSKTIPGKQPVIWLNAGGKDKITLSDPRLISFINKGIPVFLADLRGMGETVEKPEDNDWKYYNDEYHNALISLHLGRPLPGQRVDDILTLVQYVSEKQEKRNAGVKIIANGPVSPSALFAAALNPQIKSLELSSAIRSYFEILEKPMEKNWYSYVIPGVLRYFDLPDIKKMRPDLIINYEPDCLNK